MAAGPDVLNPQHRVTVPRLLPAGATPGDHAPAPGTAGNGLREGWPAPITKIRLMVGGEGTRRCWTCSAISTSTGRIVTIRPVPLTRPEHLPVQRFVSPEAVQALRSMAKPSELPCRWSPPLTRSSYPREVRRLDAEYPRERPLNRHVHRSAEAKGRQLAWGETSTLKRPATGAVREDFGGLSAACDFQWVSATA